MKKATKKNQIRITGGAEMIERCADLANDRIHKKTIADLKHEFNKSDQTADQTRSNTRAGLIVHLISNKPNNLPIRIDVDLNTDITSRLLVVAEPNANGTVIIRSKGKGSSTSLIELALAKGANINLVRIQDLGLSDNHNRLQAKLEAGAHLNLSECLFGGKCTSSWSEVHLSGSKANVNSRTLLIGAKDEKFDLYCLARHLASKTVSSINTTCVLLDKSKVMDRGLIVVEQGARGCSGSQKADTIILSNGADYVSQPELEVNEEDARCKHAAAIGQLDSEPLFYLMSRGLDEVEARRRLVEGFVAPILVDMKESGLEEMINCLIAQRF